MMDLTFIIPTRIETEDRLRNIISSVSYLLRHVPAKVIVKEVSNQETNFNEEKKIALWLLEGQVLSRSELLALCDLCEKEPRLKIIVEIGGGRKLNWQPMRSFLNK